MSDTTENDSGLIMKEKNVSENPAETTSFEKVEPQSVDSNQTITESSNNQDATLPEALESKEVGKGDNIGEKNSDESPSKRLEVIMDTLNGKEEIVTYSSDECASDSEKSEDEEDSSTADNSSSSSSDESDDDDDDDDDAEDASDDGVEAANTEKDNYDDDLEDEQTGPIRSKNEVVDEEAPVLPEDFKINEKTPLELIGKVISAVEKSVIVQANISGEFRILKEKSILCFEDRTVLGPLFEVFGRLQSPFYRVKFNSDSDLQKFKDKIGSDVYYVVPDSQFIYTDSIKAIKGTDASNWNDEEIPEEEQEFSDDEKEAASKSKKKKGKKKNSKPVVIDAKRPIEGHDAGSARKVSQYKPIYSEYKSVHESEAKTNNTSSALPQSVPRLIPTKPVEDPQTQMLKLQQQFLQIHNNNNSRSNRPNNDNKRVPGQFVPPPNMQYSAQGQSTMQQPQLSYNQQNYVHPQLPMVPNYQPIQQHVQPQTSNYNYMAPNNVPPPSQYIPPQAQAHYPQHGGYQQQFNHAQGAQYLQQPQFIQQNTLHQSQSPPPHIVGQSAHVPYPQPGGYQQQQQQQSQNQYPYINNNNNYTPQNPNSGNNNNDDVYDY